MIAPFAQFGNGMWYFAVVCGQKPNAIGKQKGHDSWSCTSFRCHLPKWMSRLHANGKALMCIACRRIINLKIKPSPKKWDRAMIWEFVFQLTNCKIRTYQTWWLSQIWRARGKQRQCEAMTDPTHQCINVVPTSKCCLAWPNPVLYYMYIIHAFCKRSLRIDTCNFECGTKCETYKMWPSGHGPSNSIKCRQPNLYFLIALVCRPPQTCKQMNIKQKNMETIFSRTWQFCHILDLSTAFQYIFFVWEIELYCAARFLSEALWQHLAIKEWHATIKIA